MNRHARLCLVGLLAIVMFSVWPLVTSAQSEAESDRDTYGEDEILAKATGFFGDTTVGLAKAVEKVFADQGRPVAYIEGEEVSGAIGIGLRYGKGVFHRKGGVQRKVYWQGPSIGWDFGGNASKAFVLLYNLERDNELFQRFPGVEGTLYFVGGFGVNYQQSGEIVLAPIRTGVGLRAGANIGYLHYTRKHSWLPL